MSSLTIEMGLRRKRGNSPEVPEKLAARDDVTLAQKQRLAMLSRMGLGPVAGAGGPPAAAAASAVVPADPRIGGPPPMDRRAQMLEKERRFREQEQRQQELEEQAELERQAKSKKPGRGGLARLGPVQPREEDIPQFPPAPAQLPDKSNPFEREGAPIRPKAGGMMNISIPKDMAERTKAPAPEPEEEDDSDDEGTDLAKDVLAQIMAAKKATAPKQETSKKKEEHKPKQGKKKKRKRRDDDDDDWQGHEEAYDEDEASEEGYEPAVRHTSNKPMPMVVEPVKGKVSLANKNFTDADLERRFQAQDARSHGSLMTEEQVLKMIRKEKERAPASNTAGSASRRVQRELAEWAAAKEQQRQRVKSPHRFERMVVSRK